MNLQLNGAAHDHTGAPRLMSLLEEIKADPGKVAVMINENVIPKDNYGQTPLSENDIVEIVIFAGGGAASAKLKIGDREFDSRLILGTGKFANVETMIAAVKASGTQLVTVALRRFNPGQPEKDDLFGPLAAIDGLTLIPNTSGARNAEEAIRAAELGRELSGSPFVKLEIHPNPHHLMPDPIETYEAAKILAGNGFQVMPYMPADPVLAKRLEDAGCAAVMPLGSAIGSGRGLQTRELVKLIIRESKIPVIIDAGLRAPSEAAAAMELGCDAVLVNSAIAAAADPAAMGAAFKLAVEAGAAGRQAGLMSVQDHAVPTSPLTSFLSKPDEK